MGLGDRIIVCGTKLAIYGMVLRFLAGPAVFAAASYLVGLRGVSLNVSIVQVTCSFLVSDCAYIFPCTDSSMHILLSE